MSDTALASLAASVAALTGELSQLRAEIARLRAENEQLRTGAQQAQERPRYRFRRLLNEWVRVALPRLRATHELSEDRVKLYRSAAKLLMRTRIEVQPGEWIRFGSLFVDELSPARAWDLRVALRQTKTRFGTVYKDNSINTYLVAAQSCLSWHCESGRKIGKNPLHELEQVDESEFRRTARPSPEEWAEIVNPTPPIVQDIAVVQYHCSMRPTEARELRRHEWYPDENKIVLTKRDGCKTGQRPIVVPAEIAAIINTRLAESRGDYVFVDPRDPERLRPLALEYVSRHMRRARRFARTRDGKRVVPYDARHGGINMTLRRAAAAGLTIADVAVHSGNSVETLMTNYHHYEMDPEAQAQLRAALESKPVTVRADRIEIRTRRGA